jgi:hypothetical protein
MPSITVRLSTPNSPRHNLTLRTLNRPGESGDSVAWEGWSHVSEFVEEISAGAA